MSGRFDGGVRFYDIGRVTVAIPFPEGERRCGWCRFCRRDNDIRYRCLLKDRILFSLEWIPDWCPVQFDNTEGENQNETD